jgi:hypothetical protein
MIALAPKPRLDQRHTSSDRGLDRAPDHALQQGRTLKLSVEEKLSGRSARLLVFGK